MTTYLIRVFALALGAAVVALGAAVPGSLSAAQPPECGTVERGAIVPGRVETGRIDGCRREEIWTFDAVRDQVVVIGMARPSPPTFAGITLDPFLRLLGPPVDSQPPVITANDDGGFGLDAEIELRVRATGQYRIVATSVEETMGDYTLSLRFRGAAAIDRGEIRPGETVSGRVDGESPEDGWWFDGVRGQRVLISMQKVRPFTLESIVLDPLLFLFRPEMDGVETVEDVSDDEDELDALIVRVLDQTGRYRIVATRVGESFGEYRLTLRVAEPSATAAP